MDGRLRQSYDMDGSAEWACARKNVYETRSDAKINAAWSRNHSGDRDIFECECKHCGKWHIGHNPRLLRLKERSRERQRQYDARVQSQGG